MVVVGSLAGAGKLASTGKPCAWYWGICFSENNGTSAAWTMPLSWPENNAPIFDNLYRKCYNKCNDDNKKGISHQTGKNAPGKRFRVYPYKIPLSGQKRRTAHLHKLW